LSKIDLHLHSYYSDGAESPETVVRRACEMGYEVIALTDHDGCLGVPEAVSAGKKLGIKVIPGIEMSAEYQGNNFMHILGYGIDINNEALQKALKDMMDARSARNEGIREVFKSRGIDISNDELKLETPNGFIGKVSFARILLKRGLVSNVSEAFQSEAYLACPEIKAIRKKKFAAEDCIELIHGAGGKVFFAHPFQLSYIGWENDSHAVYQEHLARIIGEFKELGLDGIEVCYPTHSVEDCRFLLELAERYQLLVSRGSDDHGKGIRFLKEMSTFSVEIPEFYYLPTLNML